MVSGVLFQQTTTFYQHQQEKTTKKAIWFSRHKPTAEQLREIAAGPYQLVGIEEGMASRPTRT